MEDKRCTHIVNAGKPTERRCNLLQKQNGLCNRHAPKPRKTPQVKSIDDKKSFSNFFITVNLNKKNEKTTPEKIQKFEEFIKTIMSKETIYDYLIDRKSRDPHTNVHDLSIDYQFETGPRFKRYHIHALVKLVHTGHFKFNVPKLNQDAFDKIGDRIYINIKASSDSAASWDQYIHKTTTD